MSKPRPTPKVWRYVLTRAAHNSLLPISVILLLITSTDAPTIAKVATFGIALLQIVTGALVDLAFFRALKEGET